ncbi:hypothetical protein F5Y18DRAFT_408043 [Xylariaceae sp. FL1019]|nr:hypothetical protein F5Y18DRAFT_408043 [Xylariaceae sp. FL1019]
MPQTIYLRPWPHCLPFAIELPLVIAWIILAATQGIGSLATTTVAFAVILILAIFTLLDPETTTYTHKILDDGTPVTVRRPLVGFKKYESLVGLTGGYEVRVDGYRYERAYIRI